MTLVLVAETVVVREELLVVAAEAIVEAADLGVAACVLLPEVLDRPLIHISTSMQAAAVILANACFLSSSWPAGEAVTRLTQLGGRGAGTSSGTGELAPTLRQESVATRKRPRRWQCRNPRPPALRSVHKPRVLRSKCLGSQVGSRHDGRMSGAPGDVGPAARRAGARWAWSDHLLLDQIDGPGTGRSRLTRRCRCQGPPWKTRI